MKNQFYIPDKKAGIWLDHEHAYIFQIKENYQYEMTTLDRHALLREEESSGKKVSLFKRMFLNRERKQRREHQQVLKFFERIALEVRDVHYIYLFGPGNSKLELKHYIEKMAKKFPFKVLAVDPADKITVPQMLQQVKSYFRSLRFEDSQRQLSLAIK